MALVVLALAQLVAKSNPHDIPALASFGVRVAALEPFLQHLLVPLRDRNLTGRCSDALGGQGPKRRGTRRRSRATRP